MCNETENYPFLGFARGAGRTAAPPGASKKYTTQAVPRRSVHDGKKHHDHILADYSFIAVGNSVLPIKGKPSVFSHMLYHDDELA